MEIRDWQFHQQVKGVFEGPIVFSGETRHYINADGCERNPLLNSTDQCCKLSGGVFPVHRAQDRIISALQRDVEMAAEPRLRRDHIDQITSDFLRLQRTQPDPQGETLLLNQPQQFMEIHPVLEIGSVLPQVNPSQYDLLVSLVGK